MCSRGNERWLPPELHCNLQVSSNCTWYCTRTHPITREADNHMMSEESIASEVLSASLGGAISASILYPLEVLKTKMQAESKSDDDDGDDEEDKSKLNMVEYAGYLYKSQGIQVFFSGFETSAFQSAVEKALYFFAYTGLKRVYRTLHGGASPTTLSSLLLGCCAEWAHLPVTLPLDCWTTAIQTNRDASRGPMQLLLTMLSEKVSSGGKTTIPSCHSQCRRIGKFSHLTLFRSERESEACTRGFKLMSFYVLNQLFSTLSSSKLKPPSSSIDQMDV